MITSPLPRLSPLLFVFLLFAAGPAAAAPQDCIEHGGLADCTLPELTPYKYRLCDEAPSFVSRQRVACIVWQEGQWVVHPSGPGCENTNPVALQDGNLNAKAVEFERQLRNACEADATDSGWFAAGQRSTSSYCWDGTPVYSSGLELAGLRRFDAQGKSPAFSGAACTTEWSETVYARRDRQLVCPAGYLRRTVGGFVECYKVPESCPTVGNPVLPASGGKRQTEVDYAPSGNNVLRFERTFYSYGYYRPFGMTKDRPDSMIGQYWRSNYDRRIYPAPSGAGYLASMIRPDGTIRHFDLSGNEVLTQGTFRRRLTQDTAGDWLYVNADNEEERYSPEGLLQSITDVRGVSITFTYSDENTPPEIAPQPGLLIRAASSLGRELAFVYYPSGLLKTVSAPGELTFTYSYDARENLAQVLLTGPDGASESRRYHYEDTNFPRLLTGITDQNGERFATYAYDSLGRAILTEHQGGAEKYTFTYRTEGSDAVTEVTDPMGQVRIYRHRTINGVRRNIGMSTACESCGGNTESTTYDTNGFVTSRTDFNGNVTTYQHNIQGMETSRTEAAGTPEARTITTEWHSALRLPVKITEPGKVTEYTYDSRGNRLTETITDTTGLCGDGQGNGCVRTTTYTYNSQGLLSTLDGPRTDVNDTTTFEYDVQGCTNAASAGSAGAADCTGNSISITNALDQVTRIPDYDANGNPLTIIDPNGVRTELRYDLRQRLITRTVAAGTPDEAVTHFEYDAAGNLTKIIQPTGSYLINHYDAAHRLIAVEDNEGNRIDYTLDAAGNRTAETTRDPDGVLVRTQSRVYNNLGQMIEQLGASGQTTQYEYDDNGNTTQITDPKNQITVHGFDALNRLIRIEDPANGANAPTRYEYDAQDNLTNVTDPKGLATEYRYNGFGELIRQASPDTQTSTFQYDAAGNRIAMTDARGVTVQYRYDALNRLIAVDYDEQGSSNAAGAGSAGAVPGTEEDIEYIYDQNENGIGRLATIEDQTGRTEYRYDARGNPTEMTQRFNVEDQVTLTTSYAYNAADELQQVTYPSGRIANITRNPLNQIERISINGDILADNVQYQPFGPFSQLDYSNGLREVRSYDLDDRVTRINVPGIYDLSYDYDLNSNILNIADALDNAESQDFGYDPLNRLLNAQGGYGALRYEYDPVGNRLLLTQDGVVENYSYGADNHHLLQRDDIQYQYDAAGNTVQNGQFNFQYNQANRLSLVQDATGKHVAVYRYNALGQRVLKGVGEDTPDYAALADEQEAIAAQDRANAADKQTQADALDAQATQNEQQAATNQQQAEALRQEAFDDRATADALELQIAALKAEAQPWVDRAERFRARIVEPPQNLRDRVRNAAFTLVTNVFQAIADIYLDQADALAAEAQILRNGADTKEQQVATLNDEAAQLLAEAEQAWQEAQTQRAEAAELIAQAEEAEAKAAEYRQLAENPPETKETTIFVYNLSGQILGEYRETGEPIREYVWLGDMLIAMFQGDETYFVHSDHLNTPLALTDQSQNIVWRAEYKPFGMINETVSKIEFDLRRPGQYHDSETGLYYNVNRYYSSEIGRYTQNDPAIMLGVSEGYVYVGDNPLSYTDPAGLFRIAFDSSDTAEDVATIECDGSGGIRIRMIQQPSDCIKECIDIHENKHIDQAKNAMPSICKGAKPGLQIVYSSTAEKIEKETDAYIAEIRCLRKKRDMKCTSEECKREIRNRIREIMDMITTKDF